MEWSEGKAMAGEEGDDVQGWGGRRDMVRVLMVAEKPSIATAIAKALGKNVRVRKGLSRVAQIHEYNGQFLGQAAHFK